MSSICSLPEELAEKAIDLWIHQSCQLNDNVGTVDLRIPSVQLLQTP